MSQSNEVGFFKSLFDFKFTSFITMRVIRVIYAILVVLTIVFGFLLFISVVFLNDIYSKVLKKNLNEEQIEQLVCDEIVIIACEYYRGGNYFKVLIDFWNCFLTNKPFIYFPF